MNVIFCNTCILAVANFFAFVYIGFCFTRFFKLDEPPMRDRYSWAGVAVADAEAVLAPPDFPKIKSFSK